jgi:hypothetical protein
VHQAWNFCYISIWNKCWRVNDARFTIVMNAKTHVIHVKFNITVWLQPKLERTPPPPRKKLKVHNIKFHEVTFRTFKLLIASNPLTVYNRKDGICNIIILPAVLYAFETWHLTLTKVHTFRVKISVFWVITTCSLVHRNQLFGRSSCFRPNACTFLQNVMGLHPRRPTELQNSHRLYLSN